MPTHRRSNTGASFMPSVSLKQFQEPKTAVEMQSREHSSAGSDTNGKHILIKGTSPAPIIASGPTSGKQSYNVGTKKVEVMRREKSQPDSFVKVSQ